MDGARRLGRNAMILSIVSILGGIAIITATLVFNWGCKSRLADSSHRFSFFMSSSQFLNPNLRTFAEAALA